MALDVVQGTGGDQEQGRCSVCAWRGGARRKKGLERERDIPIYKEDAWEIMGDVGLTAPTSHGNRIEIGGNRPMMRPHGYNGLISA